MRSLSSTVRKVLGAALAMVFVIVSWSPVAADSRDRTRFDRLIGKYVFDASLSENLKPKAACVCTDGGANDERAGYVTKENFGHGIVCGIPGFNGEGDWNATTLCRDWQVLTR